MLPPIRLAFRARLVIIPNHIWGGPREPLGQEDRLRLSGARSPDLPILGEGASEGNLGPPVIGCSSIVGVVLLAPGSRPGSWQLMRLGAAKILDARALVQNRGAEDHTNLRILHTSAGTATLEPSAVLSDALSGQLADLHCCFGGAFQENDTSRRYSQPIPKVGEGGRRTQVD